MLAVQAGKSKHRRAHVVPLGQDFAGIIEASLREKKGGRRQAASYIASKRTVEIIRKYLARVRAERINYVESKATRRQIGDILVLEVLKYPDEEGRYVDFRTLRTTFITNLSRAEVSPSWQ